MMWVTLISKCMNKSTHLKSHIAPDSPISNCHYGWGLLLFLGAEGIPFLLTVRVIVSFSKLTLSIWLHVAAHLCLVLRARCRQQSTDKVGVCEVIEQQGPLIYLLIWIWRTSSSRTWHLSSNNGVLFWDFAKLYRHCFPLHNVLMQILDTRNIFHQCH